MNANPSHFIDISEKLKLIAHPVRLCILTGLLEKGECNVSYMKNCLNTPQSTISQHLQKLKASGIVEARRDGLEVYYHVIDQEIIDLINFLFKTPLKR
ncbi:transcriptional repressor PagR [Andreesenia angusta]|uniref:Transcriptional repressor PagR n=1 Tax=Andreesenia angusta TaxID=39480 RepID=A0A1S1V985_9FIRM|nr:metalloregulator ArsR/SmtB family transcription factor [Andreesenia angusta]OHW63181.1 transcriptional repressor PagR [Andreesenia angusta]